MSRSEENVPAGNNLCNESWSILMRGSSDLPRFHRRSQSPEPPAGAFSVHSISYSRCRQACLPCLCPALAICYHALPSVLPRRNVFCSQNPGHWHKGKVRFMCCLHRVVLDISAPAGQSAWLKLFDQACLVMLWHADCPGGAFSSKKAFLIKVKEALRHKTPRRDL